MKKQVSGSLSGLQTAIHTIDSAVEPNPDPARLVQINKRVCLEDVITQVKLGGFRPSTPCVRERKTIQVTPSGFRHTNRYHHAVNLPHFGITMEVDTVIADYTPLKPMDRIIQKPPLAPPTAPTQVPRDASPELKIASSLEHFAKLQKNLKECEETAKAFRVLPNSVISREPYLAHLKQKVTDAAAKTRSALDHDCGIRPSVVDEVTEAESALFEEWAEHLAKLEDQMKQLGRTEEQVYNTLREPEAQKALFLQYLSQKQRNASHVVQNNNRKKLERPFSSSVTGGGNSNNHHNVNNGPLSSRSTSSASSSQSRLQQRLLRDVERQTHAFEVLHSQNEQHREVQRSALKRVFQRHQLRAKQLFNRASRAMQEHILVAREFANRTGSATGGPRVSASVLFCPSSSDEEEDVEREVNKNTTTNTTASSARSPTQRKKRVLSAKRNDT